MKSTGTFVLAAALTLCGCAQGPAESQPEEHIQAEGLEAEQRQTEQQLSEEQMAAALAYLEQHEGNWVERDGARFCEGYLTRYADEDYCASDVPEDWRPFEFDGQTYYLQPLVQE